MQNEFEQILGTTTPEDDLEKKAKSGGVLQENLDTSFAVVNSAQETKQPTPVSNLKPIVEPSKIRSSITLTGKEAAAREQGTIEAETGVVRVSDSPDTLDDNSFVSTKGLYENTLGVTQYDSLRAKVGLKDGESFTDYYNRTGYIPEGFEMEAKMLLAEEKRKKLYQKVVDGEMSETDFLYEAYGKDLLKADKHYLDSSLYWYQRRKSGLTDSVLDNNAYMSTIISHARQLFEAEEWFEKSQTASLSDTAASYISEYVTGERLDATKVREIFGETFDVLDDYYSSDEKIVQLYRGGYLQGFDPTIDIDNDGKVDYYYHTDGKLYAIKGSSGEGTAWATAHYNDDGSLNRISTIGNLAGETTHTFLKGFTGFFTGIVDFGAMLGGGIVDIGQGIAGQGWDFSAATDASAAWNAFLNQNSFGFGNDAYIADGGFQTDDGQVNWAAISRGAGTAVGTIAAIAATMGISAIAGAATSASSAGVKATASAASAAAKAAGKSGTRAAIKAGAKQVALKGVAKTAQFMRIMTGIANGQIASTAAKSAMRLTLESIAILAVKDFMQTGVALTANKEQLGLTDGEIAGKALLVSGLNAGISFLLRGTNDMSALDRLGARRQIKQSATGKLVDSVDDTFKSFLNSWYTKHPKAYLAAGTIMDMSENILTSMTQMSMSQTGKLFDAEAWKSQLSDPSFLATQLWMGYQTVRGTGKWRNSDSVNEGMATGSIIDKLGSVEKIYTDVISDLKLKAQEATDPAKANAITAYINEINKIASGENATDLFQSADADRQVLNKRIQGLTKALAKIHDDLNVDGESVVKTHVSKSVAKEISAQQIQEFALAVNHYNAYINNRLELVKKTQDPNFWEEHFPNWISGKAFKVDELYKKSLESLGIKFKAFDSESNKIYISKNYEKFGTPELQNLMKNCFETKNINPIFAQDKDGKWSIDNAFKDVEPEKLQVILDDLNSGVLTKESLMDGFIFKLKNDGSNIQSNPDYQTLQKSLELFIRIIEFEADQGYGRTAYKLDDNTIILPSMGNEFFNLKAAYDLYQFIYAVYGLRHSTDAKTKRDALKEIYKLRNMGNDDMVNKDYIDLLEMFYSSSKTTGISSLLSIEDAAQLYEAILEENPQAFKDKNVDKDYIHYSNGSKAWDDMVDAFENYKKNPSDDAMNAFKKKYATFIKTPNNIQEELVKNSRIDSTQLKALSKEMQNFQTGQTLSSGELNQLNQLKKYLDVIEAVNKEDEVKKNRNKEVVILLSHIFSKEVPLEDSKTFSAFASKNFDSFSMSKVVKGFISEFAQDFDLSKVTEESIQKYIVKEGISKKKELKQLTVDNIKNSIEDFQKNSYTTYITDILNTLDPTLKSFLEQEFAIQIKGKTTTGILAGELTNIEHRDIFESVYSKLINNVPLATRMQEASDTYHNLLKGTDLVEGDGYVYVNISELTGYYTDRLAKRYADNLNSANFNKDLSDAESVRILFGDSATVEDVIEGLTKENQTRNTLLQDYPEGYIKINKHEAEGVRTLETLLTKLNYTKDNGYNTAIFYNNKEVDIEGFYTKEGMDAAIKLDLAKNNLAELITAIRNKQAEKAKALKESSTKDKETYRLDVISQLDDSLGSLTFITDDTVINPNRILFSSVSSDVDSINTVALYTAYEQIVDAASKLGKLGGSATAKLLSFGTAGFSVKTPADPDLYNYEILLNCIDAVASLYKDKEKDVASRISLTKEEAEEFKKKGLWQIISTGDKKGDKDIYQLMPKQGMTEKSFKQAAYELLSKEDTCNLNFIIPCYDVYITEDYRVYEGNYELNSQTSPGSTPIYKAISSNTNHYHALDIINLFKTAEFSNKYKALDNKSREAALKAMQNRSVKDILADTGHTDNIYFVMMQNALRASKKLSYIIVGASDTREGDLTRLIPLLGDSRVRKVLGAILFENMNEDVNTLLTKIKEDTLLRNIDNRTVDYEGTSRKSYLNSHDSYDAERNAYITGAEADVFNIKNTDNIRNILKELTVEDVKTLQSLIEYTYETTRVAEETQTDILNKLLTHILAGNSTDKQLNLFIDSLTQYNKEGMEEIKSFLKPFLTKESYELLENKLKSIEDTDMFKSSLEQYPESTIGENILGTAASLIQTNQAFRDGTDKWKYDDPQSQKAIEYALLSLRKKKFRKTYKLSELEMLNNNSEQAFTHAFAQMLGQEVMPNVSRQASLLIQNFEVKEYQAQFIDAISDTSLVLEEHFKNINPSFGNNSYDLINLALKLYLYSSNTDYQSEWTKYVFVNPTNGDIINTAQRMTGMASLNDFYTSLNKTFDSYFKGTNDSPLVIFNLEKNMMLGYNPLKGMTYDVVGKGADMTDISVYREEYIKNALRQFEYLKDKKSYTGSTDLEKANFVYSHRISEKTMMEEIIEEFKPYVPEETLNRALRYNLYDLQSSKATNDVREQLFLNTYMLVNGLQGTDRTKVNVQMKALNDLMKYEMTYDALPKSLQDDLNSLNSEKFTYTYIKTNKDGSVQTDKEGNPKTVTKTLSTSSVTKALLSNNETKLKEAIQELIIENPKASKDLIFKAIIKDYLYNSKEAGALSMLFTEHIEARGKSVLPIFEVGSKEYKVKDLLTTDSYYIDVEAFFDKTDGVSVPFQIAIRHVVNGKMETVQEIFIPLKNSDGTYYKDVESLKKNFPAFFTEYYDKNEGSRKAVTNYLNSLNKTTGLDSFNLKDELTKILGNAELIVGFNSDKFDIPLLIKTLGDDSLFKDKTLDVYTVLNNLILSTEQISNKRQLETLISELGIKVFDGKEAESHDAAYDTAATFKLLETLINSAVDIADLRIDAYTDIEHLGRLVYEDDSLDFSRLVSENKFNIKDFSIDETRLSTKGQEFIDSYKKSHLKYLTDETEAAKLGGALSKLNSRIETLYNNRERQVQMKKYYATLNSEFTKGQREFLSYINAEQGYDNVVKLVSFIYDRIASQNLDKALDVLSDIMFTSKNSNGKNKINDYSYQNRVLELLQNDPKEFIKEFSLEFLKLMKVPDTLEKLLVEFDSSTSKNLDAFKAKLDEFKDDSENLLAFRAVKKDIQMAELQRKKYDYQQDLLEDIINQRDASGNYILNEDLRNSLLYDINNMLLDTSDNTSLPARNHSNMVTIASKLTEQQKKFLYVQPTKKLKQETFYGLVQSAYSIKRRNQEPLKVQPDTIYMSPKRFKTFFETSEEVIRKTLGIVDGEPILIPMMRHPADGPAVSFYKVEVVNSPDVELVMSIDALKALHRGDVDGDHISLIKPSKATYEFAKEIMPTIKVAWNIFGDISEHINRSVKDSEFISRQKAIEVFTAKYLETDLKKLHSGKANYESLKQKALSKLEKELNITEEDAIKLLPYCWIKQGPDVSRFGTSNVKNIPYYSISPNSSGIKINQDNTSLIKSFRQLQQKVSSFADTGSGQQQKDATLTPSITKDLTALKYNAFSLEDNTFDMLDNYIENNLDEVRTLLLNSLKTHITQKSLNLTEIENNIKTLTSAQDFCNILVSVEDLVRKNSETTSLFSKALKNLHDNYTTGKELYDEYDRVLRDYVQSTTTSPTKPWSFFETQADTINMLDQLLNYNITGGYVANSQSPSRYKEAILTKIAKMSNKTPGKTTNVVPIEGYQNKVQGKVMFILKENPREKYKLPLVPDTSLLGPAMEDKVTSLFLAIQLDKDEHYTKGANLLKKGMPFTDMRKVPDELDGYKVIKRAITKDTGETHLILAKDYAVDGQTKVVLTGTSAVKNTISGKAYKRHFPAGLIDDCLLITNIKEFEKDNKEKIPAEIRANYKYTYYDADGKVTTDLDNAYYMSVDNAEVSQVEDTKTWGSELKESIVDGVFTGMNRDTLEGQISLGGHTIKIDDNGEVSIDTSFDADVDRLLRNIQSPQYVHANGAILYKKMLYATLRMHDNSGDSIEDKHKDIQNKFSNMEFMGEKGTYDIAQLLSKYTTESLNEMVQTLNPSEQVLFDEEFLNLIFQLDKNSLNISEELPKQGSKKSYASTLLKALGVLNKPKFARGALANEMNIVQRNGKQVRLDNYETSYISALEFMNSLNTKVHKLKEGKTNRTHYLNTLNQSDVEDLYFSGLLEHSHGFSGTQATQFYPMDRRYTNELQDYFRPGYETKTSTNVDSTLETRGINSKIIVPGETSSILIDPVTSTRRTIDSSNEYIPTKDTYSSVVKKKVGNLLKGVLLSGNEKDIMAKGNLIFKPNDDMNMSLTMNRVAFGQRGTDLLPIVQGVNTHTVSNLGQMYSAINDTYSTKAYHDTRILREQRLNEASDSLKGLTVSLKEPELDKSLELSKSVTKSDRIKEDFGFYKTSAPIPEKPKPIFSTMTHDFREGRTDYTQKIYKTDGLESSNLKIEDEASANAAIITTMLMKEPEAVKLQFSQQVNDLYQKCVEMKVVEQFNKYAYYLGTLDRLKVLEAKYKNADNSKRPIIESHIVEIKKLFPDGPEGAVQFCHTFETHYGYIIDSYKTLLESMNISAKHVANLSLEPTSNAFFLITPTIRSFGDKSSKAQHYATFNMIMNTEAYITSRGKSDNFTESYQTYTGYNFFNTIQDTLNELSKQIACHTNAQRLKREGYMENVTIASKVDKFLEGCKATLRQTQLYKNDETFNRITSLIANDIKDSSTIISQVKSRQDTLSNESSNYKDGMAWVELYEALQNEAKSNFASYIEAKQASRTAESEITRQTAEEAVKYYEYANDVLAILLTKTKQGKNLLADFGGQLKPSDKDSYCLVDTYGRILHEDVTKFKRLSEASFESTNTLLRYYLTTNDQGMNFNINVALDAINGDLYYMPRSLAENLDRMVFTTKQPSNIKSILSKVNHLAIKLLMSSPFKLVDRMIKFTGFDLATLGMANPKTLLKTPRAKRELSAYWSSKGSILQNPEAYPELREFLYSQGLDPNKTDIGNILNGTNEQSSSGHLFSSYFDFTNKSFTYQTLLERYAFWLACKEDLQNGKVTHGSAYSKKDIIDSMTEITDADGNVKVSKEGNQAAFIMAQNIGAPGDFPALAKKLNGYAAFTTFPLALLRWGKGQASSLGTAFKNLFIEGERRGALKHLGVTGMGITGIYLSQFLISEILASMFNIPEEEKEEWQEDQAVPNVLQTLIQGTPIMDSYSSFNPLHELGKMTVGPIVEDLTDEDEETNLGTGLLSWATENVIGHVNPVAKTVAESITGYDIIGDNIISNKDEYNTFENLLRKFGGYLVGSAGANAIAKYAKSSNVDKSFGEGIQRAVSAELGNTKAYKSNQNNYYKAFEIVNTYIYADQESNNTFQGKDTFNSIKKDIRKVLNDKGSLADIYSVIDKYIAAGVDFSIIKSAAKNCSLYYKVNSKVNTTEFMNSLTTSEYNCIKSALTYEDYMFPWLDELEDLLTKRYKISDSSNYSSTPYVNNYFNMSSYNMPGAQFNYYSPSTYTYYPKAYNQNYTSTYSPISTYNYLMNKWKYGKSTDLYGNQYTGYTNIKGDVWKWEGDDN